MKISNYLKLSKEANDIYNIYISADEFKQKYMNLVGFEQGALISHIILNNLPFVFRSKPILYEMIVKYLSDVLNVNNKSIYLIGSAKTGFSMSPGDDYGKQFSENSDLDFTIVDENLFNKLANEFIIWRRAYLIDGTYKPKSDKQEVYWKANILLLEKNINRGFLDPYKIPNIDICPGVMNINNIMYLIYKKLDEYHGIKIKGVSVRVYKNENAFINQLSLNTSKCVK